ncbi:MAG: hypothetical protein SWY16_17935 [Cyanobacteriota bacterium]|nr:hypothetical protein [Cyanobacteriota bacterium]
MERPGKKCRTKRYRSSQLRSRLQPHEESLFNLSHIAIAPSLDRASPATPALGRPITPSRRSPLLPSPQPDRDNFCDRAIEKRTI